MDTPRVKDLIKKAEVDTFKEAMEQGIDEGCQTFDYVLLQLYKEDKISLEQALINADSANNLRLKIKLEGLKGDDAINALLDKGPHATGEVALQDSRRRSGQRPTDPQTITPSPPDACQAALLPLSPVFRRLGFQIRGNFLQRQRAQFCAVPRGHRLDRIAGCHEDAGFDHRLDDVLVNGLRLAPIQWITQPLRATGAEPQRRADAALRSCNAWDAMTDGTAGPGEDDRGVLLAGDERHHLRHQLPEAEESLQPEAGVGTETPTAAPRRLPQESAC